MFASSVPKGKRGARAGSPSQRSAAGDLWTGFGGSSAKTPAVAEAEVPAPTSLMTGMAILALGLVGIAGTFLVAALGRRRRAVSRGETHGR